MIGLKQFGEKLGFCVALRFTAAMRSFVLTRLQPLRRAADFFGKPEPSQADWCWLSGWMLDRREIAATIRLESSCMVATSRSSKA